MAVLASMADMAMEGTGAVTAALDFVLAIRSPVVEQDVLETLAVICRSNYERAAEILAPDYGMETGDAETAWKDRFARSAARIGSYAMRTAGDRLGNPETSVSLAAVKCVGAAGRPPAGLPGMAVDFPETLRTAIRRLALMSMSPDADGDMRKTALRALGEIGTANSVRVIREIVNSPYASPENGSEGLAMADASVSALFDVVTAGREGAPEAEKLLLHLLGDGRSFASPKPNVDPTLMGYLVMWRMQRLARSGETSLDPEFWSSRLGWGGK